MHRLTFKYIAKGEEKTATKIGESEQELKQLAQTSGKKYKEYWYWIEKINGNSKT